MGAGSRAPGEDTTIRAWDVATATELRHWSTNQLLPRALAISPDGRLLFAAGAATENPVRVWDAESGQELRPLSFGSTGEAVRSIAVASDSRILVTGSENGIVQVWEIASRQQCQQLLGHAGRITRVAISNDRRLVASVSTDTTCLIWQLGTLTTSEREIAKMATAKQVATWWADLSSDAARASRAIRLLAAAPSLALPMVRQHVKPQASVAKLTVERLIADLGDQKFGVRDAASRELEKCGPAIILTLSRAATTTSSAESAQRLRAIIARLASTLPSPVQMRELRAVEVLERIGTPEAQAILRELAQGAADAALTREAAQALRRLESERPKN